MKIILIGIICFVAGWLAIKVGIIPPEFARTTGMILAIPAGLMFGNWLSDKVNGCQSFALIPFMFAALIGLPVLFGWMTWADWANKLSALVEWVMRITR